MWEEGRLETGRMGQVGKEGVIEKEEIKRQRERCSCDKQEERENVQYADHRL